MTSQEVKGSFMKVWDVLKYFKQNNHDSSNLPFVEIDGNEYIPIEIVENRINNVNWKKMQSKVTIYMFG